MPLLYLLGSVVLIASPARADYTIDQWVFGNGGDRVSNGVHLVECTIGQPVIGLVSGPVHIHEIGFWQQWIATATGIEDLAGSPPIEFWLGQNHPNPFNPSTTLEFSIPERSRVTITLYDATGRHVRELADQVFDRGYHSTTVVAHGMPSGMYYCRLQAGTFVHTKKLVLVK
jgi:hypothetical protein